VNTNRIFSQPEQSVVLSNQYLRKSAGSGFLLFSILSLWCAGASIAANFTSDGGGANGNTGTAANWVGDVAPAATGDNLIFAGTTNLAVTNNSITSLTFEAGAGAFVLRGNSITVGTNATTNIIYLQSASNVEIQNNRCARTETVC
jgi:hypothetical protein